MIQPYSQNSYSFPQPVTRPKWILQSYDRIFAWLMLPAGFLFVRYVLFYADGLHTTVLFLLMHLAGSIYIRKTGSRPQRMHRILSLIICIFALSFPLTASPLLHGLCAAFLIPAMIWRVHSVCGGLPAVTQYFPFDLGESLLSDPMFYYSAGAQSLSESGKRSRTAGAVRTALLGLLLMIPLTVVIAALLASADAGVERIFIDLLSHLSGNAVSIFIQFFMSIPFGLFFFAVLYSASQRRARQAHDDAYYEAKLAGARQIPLLAVCAGVTPVCLLYLLFIASQINYYISAFSGRPPVGMTLAESARSGFFELCAVAVINFILLLVMNLLTKRSSEKRSAVLTFYSAFFCIVTLFIIAAALAKMAIYIGAYGLTQNRVIASWFMLLLALFFAVLLLKQFIRNIPAAVILASAAAAMLAGLCFAHPDARIAEYNIARYEAGTLEQLDAASLCALSEDAYVAMLRHPETLEAAGQLDYVLKCAQEREQEIRTINGRSSNLSAQMLLQQLHTDTGHGLLLRRAS
ncbi:MAG: DUF4173 domain-containing protein [Oscillospiraceae bacterium]|nr:DUF4173 domain-containing protein [Oscillospiraceae bacterium]